MFMKEVFYVKFPRSHINVMGHLQAKYHKVILYMDTTYTTTCFPRVYTRSRRSSAFIPIST
jgi:hypothetical protein